MKFLLILILFPFYASSQSNAYKNLALEGGGIRGIAYAGAFKVLEEKGVLQNIDKVAGSSAGAIAGLMLALNYSTVEIDSMLNSTSFQKFNDGHWGLAGKYIRFRKKFGIYNGRAYENWMQELTAKKTGNPNFTFRELHELHLTNKGFRDLYITGTNLSKQRLEVFSFETTPDFSIATAVRISGGIPLYFAPIVLDDHLRPISADDTASFRNFYVDGGMLANYPISIFDSCIGNSGTSALICDKIAFNMQTIGIKLERQNQIDNYLAGFNTTIPSFRLRNMNQFVDAFANLSLENAERKYPGMLNEKDRTIYVSYGDISPRIKKMSKQEKELLYNNGRRGAELFFAK